MPGPKSTPGCDPNRSRSPPPYGREFSQRGEKQNRFPHHPPLIFFLAIGPIKRWARTRRPGPGGGPNRWRRGPPSPSQKRPETGRFSPRGVGHGKIPPPPEPVRRVDRAPFSALPPLADEQTAKNLQGAPRGPPRPPCPPPWVPPASGGEVLGPPHPIPGKQLLANPETFPTPLQNVDLGKQSGCPAGARGRRGETPFGGPNSKPNNAGRVGGQQSFELFAQNEEKTYTWRTPRGPPWKAMDKKRFPKWKNRKNFLTGGGAYCGAKGATGRQTNGLTLRFPFSARAPAPPSNSPSPPPGWRRPSSLKHYP